MQIVASAPEREQERLAMVATLESLRLHYRPDMNEVFSGADEAVGRIDALAMCARRAVGRWLAIGEALARTAFAA